MPSSTVKQSLSTTRGSVSLEGGISLAGLLVPKIECTEQGENFGRFIAEPLEKGFGVTLGNSLRRVLIGYLPGAAITQVRIEGVHHEFTVIPNAKEDVIEFLLNWKRG